MFRSPLPARSRRFTIASALAILALSLLSLGCPNGSDPAPTTVPPAGGGGTGGGGGAVCGNAVLEGSEQCDDGNAVSGDGCSRTCETETVGGPARVSGVLAVADAAEGATLRLDTYTAPADGLLVVRIGARGSTSQSVTFAGEDMIHVSSMEVTYWATMSVEMFYLPVRSGDSGAIEVDYGFAGTDEKGIIAATLPGADAVVAVQTYTGGEVNQDGRTGPNLVQPAFASPEASVVLTAFTDVGSGIPTVVGAGHVMDAHPTVPESVFHETKVMAGHAIAPAAGTTAIGYRNTFSSGFMDYVMIVAAFSVSD